MAGRITVRVANPRRRKRRRRNPPSGAALANFHFMHGHPYGTPCTATTCLKWVTRGRKMPKRRRRRNPGEQLDLYADTAEKLRAKSLGKRRAFAKNKKGTHRLRRWRSALKQPHPARVSSRPRVSAGSYATQGSLDEALAAAQIPRVNRRGISARPIVILPGGRAVEVSPSVITTARKAQPKKRKPSGRKRSSSTNRAVRKAARKGERKMAKRRRKKGRRGHRRVRCISYQVTKGRSAGKWFARRVNPSLPVPVAGALGVIVGAVGGVALSYLADKIGVGTPNQRSIGLVASGAAIGGLGHRFAPGASTAIGAGVAGIGLLRAVQTMLYATPSTPVDGLGYGDGYDISGPFAQIGGGGVFDRIGEVVDMGGVYSND